MKKLVVAAISFASCGNKTAANANNGDSGSVAQVDTADTAAVDTAAADTAK